MKYGIICKKFVLISNVSGCLNENYLNLVNPKEGVTKAGYLKSARGFPLIDELQCQNQRLCCTILLPKSNVNTIIN